MTPSRAEDTLLASRTGNLSAPPGTGSYFVVGVDPSLTELARIRGLPEAADWAGFEGAPDDSSTLRGALFRAVGNPTSLRDVALLEPSEWGDLLHKLSFWGVPLSKGPGGPRPRFLQGRAACRGH
eukprot:4522045-Lingulodinium_polyedra.AAC.1